MLPIFPNFKKLELTDRKDIESYTSQHDPYSDFNFTSLWVWDVTKERMISELNGNLVVRFTDYATHDAFLSFLGKNKPTETARKLIEFAKETGINSTLGLIPEECIKEIKNEDFIIEEDRDNFDYIISTEKLAELNGYDFKSKRHLAEKFIKNNPEAIFLVKELRDINDVKQKIISAFHKWDNNKKLSNKTSEIEHEKMAIGRLLETMENHDLILACVFIKEEMIGFSIDEKLHSGYTISHFTKADILYTGVYDFLNRELARYLLKNKKTLWNWEQDLGLMSIRKSKMSYRPTNFLKKYKVSLNEK